MFALRKIGALKLFILIPNIFGTILAIVMLGVGLVGIINVGKFSMEGNFKSLNSVRLTSMLFLFMA